MKKKLKFHFRIPGLKRIDTYIIAKFLGTYFFAILLIISISVVFDYNENIDKFTLSGAPWREIIFDYYLNFIPYYANLFSALFVFISVIFFTSNLAGNSEIIAMISTGMSFRRLMRPYMMSAAVIAILSFYLGSEVIPHGNVTRLAFENTYKRKKKNATYADNVQLQVDSGVIAYIEHFDGPTKMGYNFQLDKFRNKKLISHLTAPTIVYDSISSERFHWHIQNVTIRTFKGMREVITHKPDMDSVIIMEPADFLVVRNRQESMTNQELLDYIARNRMRGNGNLAAFQVEYYRRFADPCSAFILTLIGASLSSRKRKGGMGFYLGIGLILSFAYIFFQGVSSTFAVNDGFPPLLAVWLPNITFAIIALYLYKKAPR